MTTTPTPADRPADQLRAAVARALVRYDWNAGLSGRDTPSEHHYGEADAVLSVLPAPALAVARQLLGTTESDRRCVCGDPIEWMTHPDGPGWIHSPGSETRCLDARPAAAPPAPADRAATRDRIRRAICEASGFTWLPDELMEPDEYGEHADAVLAVLDAEAAAEAHPPSVEYIAEVLELDGAWEYLGAHADPAVAARRRASVTRRHPDVETRTVRKTTTYTVEPEPAAPAAPEETR